MIQLSILIPSIPSRFDISTKLFQRLSALIKSKHIEIIMLTDNKIMSIGEKCNHLLSSCHGKYFCFIHDDDELVSLSQIYKATFFDVDVISFKAKCRNADGSTYIVTQKLGSEVEHKTKKGRYLDCNRPPFPNCVWNKERFGGFRFPNVSYGEDWGFIEQCLEIARTEIHIDKILFKYNFDPKITEASTKTNEIWANPNE